MDVPPPCRARYAEPFVPATLEPLRDCGHLTLESKRSLACVNHEGKRIFTEHLRLGRLEVKWRDCTLSNARFVVDHLMKAVDKLILVAEGELLKGELNLSELKYEPRIRLKNKEGVCLGATAAFFVGHVLAQTDCIVRLTTGKAKCLRSLRENPRIWLSPEDTYQPADHFVLAPALHRNAIRRIRHCNGEDLILAHLYMDDMALKAITPEFCKLTDTLRSLDLSHNSFGAVGMRALFDNPYTLMPMLQLKTLCLKGTEIRSEGAISLAKLLEAGQLPALENLLLSKTRIGNDGVEALAPHLRHLSRLKVLDLSANTFGDKAVDSLLQPDRLPLSKLVLLNLHDCRYVSVSGYKKLALAVRNQAFPKLHDLCVNKKGAFTVLRKALRVLQADRDWAAEYHNDPELQRCANGLQTVYTVSRVDAETSASSEEEDEPMVNPFNDY